MVAETGATTSRLLNKLAYDVYNKASALTSVATDDRIPVADTSADGAVKYVVPADLVAGAGVTASAAELNYVDITAAGTAQASKAMVTDANVGIGGAWRDTRAVRTYAQAAPATPTDTATLTAAQLLTGQLNSTPTAAAAYTLPLATDMETALIAAVPGLQNLDAFDFGVTNLATGNFDITMTTNTGWTLGGNMVVQESAAATGSLSAAIFQVKRTSSTAYVLTRIG